METLECIIKQFALIIIQYHNDLRTNATVEADSVLCSHNSSARLIDLIDDCERLNVGLNRLEHMRYLHHLWEYFTSFISTAADATDEQWAYFEDLLVKHINNLKQLLTTGTSISIEDKSYQLTSFVSYSSNMFSLLGGGDSHMGQIIRASLIDKIQKSDAKTAESLVSILCLNRRKALAESKQQEEESAMRLKQSDLINTYREKIQAIEENNQRLTGLNEELESQLDHAMQENSNLVSQNSALKQKLVELKHELAELKQQRANITSSFSRESEIGAHHETEQGLDYFRKPQENNDSLSWLGYLSSFFPFFSLQPEVPHDHPLFPPTDMVQLQENYSDNVMQNSVLN